MCALSKAARAGNKSDVMGESGGVSEGVAGLPLQCARLYCQVSATQTLSLSVFIYIISECCKGFCPTAIKKVSLFVFLPRVK